MSQENETSKNGHTNASKITQAFDTPQAKARRELLVILDCVQRTRDALERDDDDRIDFAYVGKQFELIMIHSRRAAVRAIDEAARKLRAAL